MAFERSGYRGGPIAGSRSRTGSILPLAASRTSSKRKPDTPTFRQPNCEQPLLAGVTSYDGELHYFCSTASTPMMQKSAYLPFRLATRSIVPFAVASGLVVVAAAICTTVSSVVQA